MLRSAAWGGYGGSVLGTACACPETEAKKRTSTAEIETLIIPPDGCAVRWIPLTARAIHYRQICSGIGVDNVTCSLSVIGALVSSTRLFSELLTRPQRLRKSYCERRR